MGGVSGADLKHLGEPMLDRVGTFLDVVLFALLHKDHLTNLELFTVY
jgi:hypothetical protein